MTRAEYEKSICDRLAQAAHVPYRRVSFADGSIPAKSACHENADRWVTENPDCRIVRGWVTYADFWIAIGLTAHSVVQDQDGQLFDITPLGNERDRIGMQFVPHIGTEQEFKTMQQLNVFMRCPVNE